MHAEQMIIKAVVSFQLRIDVERERNDRMGCDRHYSLAFFVSLFWHHKWAEDKLPKLHSKLKIPMTIAMAAKTAPEALTEMTLVAHFLTPN